LMTVNLFLAGFNLIPAFPMDGGRVLRALLAMRLEYTRATQIAAGIGQGMALLFGLIGLFSNPFLVFIALFVWIGAQQEASMVQMKTALGGIPVGRAMLTEYHTVSPHNNLAQVVELLLGGSQHNFPVVDEGRVVGVLTRNDLFSVLNQRNTSTLVSDVMRRDFETVDANDMLEPAFNRLQSCNCGLFPVLRNGQLVGLLTAENIGEFLMIQAARERRDRKQPGMA